MGLSVTASFALCVFLATACVDNGDVGDAAAQGSLGGPCFANNTCNTDLVCVLVNGKGVCEQTDATTDQTTSETGADVTQDQTTQDVTGDVAPVDAGCEASVAAVIACFGCGAGDLCCPATGQCFTGGCPSNCNNAPCWSCTRGSDCSGQFCCVPNSAVQPTCPPTASVDKNVATSCTTTCPNGVFVCQANGDCPSTAPTCVGATVSGLAHATIGVCQ